MPAAPIEKIKIPDWLKEVFTMPPAKAVAFLKAKGLKAKWNWDEILGRSAAESFSVAKLMNLDLLQTVYDEVQTGLAEGKTIEQFQKDLEPRLRAAGFWGKQTLVNPKTGIAETVQTGSPWRLETIYRTNLQSSYMAGRYSQQKAVKKTRPYWQYIAIADSRTRPAHLALNGRILPADDPFWDSNYPPNGFNCRCRVRTLSAAEVEAEGLDVQDGSEVDFTPDKGFDVAPTNNFEPSPGSYHGKLYDEYKKQLRAGP